MKREATARLSDDTLRAQILEAVARTEEAAERRNNVTHRELVLAGPEPAPDDDGPLDLLEPLRRRERWRKAAARGEGLWHERPARSWSLTPARTEQDDIAELREITVVLEGLEREISSLASATARARDLNEPPQWTGPAVTGQRLRATFSLAGLILTDPATGAQRATVSLDVAAHKPAAIEQNGAHRWHRFLPWFDDLEEGRHGRMSTAFLDQALAHAGWQRVMPWTDDDAVDSTSTTIEQRL